MYILIRCAPLISFAYEVHATPEPSRAHQSRTMPRCLGSIASHDASMLDHHASHLATLPRCLIASPRTLPQCLARSRRTLPPCHLATLPPCLDDARTLARTLPRCLATEPTSCLAVIARHSEARCLARLARLANHIPTMAIGVLNINRSPNLGPIEGGGGGGPTDRKFV